MSYITEQATSPNTSIPVIGTVGAANWIGMAPEIINVLTVIYLVLLVAHKGYNMYKEYKTGKDTEKDES
jgi:hypothetical protein